MSGKNIDYGIVPGPEQLVQGNVSAYKQGHKCCGGCCDMRRAVIIVNIVNVVLSFFHMSFLILSDNMLKIAQKSYEEEEANTPSEYQDPDYAKVEKDLNKMERTMGWLIFAVCLMILANGAGIFGAIKFHLPSVGVATGGYVISLFLAVFTFNPFVIFIHGFFLYPHAFLLKEMHEGTMTPENYINEEFSCCCA